MEKKQGAWTKLSNKLSPSPKMSKKTQAKSNNVAKNYQSIGRVVDTPLIKERHTIFFGMLNHLDFQTILNLRLVDRSFNLAITSKRVSKDRKYHNSYLWNRGKITFPKKSIQHFSNVDQINPKLFHEFRAISTEVTAPNLCFREVDVLKMSQSFVQFFSQHGPHIQELYLEQCRFSISTLQNIHITCPNLHVLEIAGTFHRLEQLGKIFGHSKDEHLQNVFPNLRKLKLKNTSQQRNEIVDLPYAFLGDLTSSKHLKYIEINKFGFESVLRVLQCLRKKSQSMKKELKTSLIFREIATQVDTVQFYDEICKLEHFKMKKFELGFQPCLNELTQSDQEIEERKQIEYSLPENQATYLDAAISKILVQHGSTLEEFVIINLPVSERIFYALDTPFPQMKKLNLYGTRIICLTRETKKLLKYVKEVKIADDEEPGSNMEMECPFENAPSCQRGPTVLGVLGIEIYSYMDYILLGLILSMLAFLMYIIMEKQMF